MSGFYLAQYDMFADTTRTTDTEQCSKSGGRAGTVYSRTFSGTAQPDHH